MDNLEEIKKGISEIKLSVIIAVLVAFFVSWAFVSVIVIGKLNKISIVIQDINDKTFDYRLRAEE